MKSNLIRLRNIKNEGMKKYIILRRMKNMHLRHHNNIKEMHCNNKKKTQHRRDEFHMHNVYVLDVNHIIDALDVLDGIKHRPPLFFLSDIDRRL